jgi:hypothetical protein
MSRAYGTGRVPDLLIREAQERLEEQKAVVRRSIIRGTPSQAAEDQLRQLEWALLRAKERRLDKRSSDIRRKIARRSR